MEIDPNEYTLLRTFASFVQAEKWIPCLLSDDIAFGWQITPNRFHYAILGRLGYLYE